MSNTYFFSNKNVMYVKLPETIEEDAIEIVLKIPKKFAGNSLRITNISKNQADDMQLKTECIQSDCNKCEVANCPAHL